MKSLFTFIVALTIPATAYAHEVLHTIERGRAMAVKAFFADGEPLAYVEYEVYSPKDRNIPYQKGRTDRGGYLAFVPDTPGKWRVKVSDASGHGLDLLEIPVTTDKAQAAAPSRQDEALSTAAFVLRPMIGLAIIAAIFSALTLIYRLRGRAKS